MKKFTPTKGQQKTLDIINYFGQAGDKLVKNWNEMSQIESYADGAIQDSEGIDATQAFLERNDKGIPLSGRKVTNIPALVRLLVREDWCGRQMAMYQEGILDGSMPYIVILEDMPRFAVDYLKGNLFRGADSETIERAYQILQDEKVPWWKRLFKKLNP